jgi:hypothetical protein
MRAGLSVIFLLVLAGPAAAQSVQEMIELDRQLALQKRKAELAEAKRRTEALAPSPARPLVAPEPRRPEDDFQVRGVFGPLDNLSALVSYRGDVPVVLGRAASTQTVGGWSLATLSPQQIVLERPRGKATRDRNGTLVEGMERIVVPVRLNPLPAAGDMKGPSPLPGQGVQVFGAPISPVLAR